MNPALTPAKSPSDIQIDLIANTLPDSVRADFYREMKYCSSLSKSDEMLHILNILRILGAVMVDVPTRIASEREKLDEIVRDAKAQMQEHVAASKAYHKQIDDRLAQLPAEIATGINPTTVAAAINESLRQQFAKSTIPETAKALAGVAKDLRSVTADFATRSSALGDTYDGAVAAAKKATTELHSAITEATESAKQATQVLATTYGHSYRWAFYALSALGVFVGSVLMVLLFMMFFGHSDRTTSTATEPPQKIERLQELPQPERGVRHANNPRHVQR